jgi:hypothetical protein
MRKIIFLFWLFLGFNSFAQTWSDGIAQLVYDKCTKCHHTGGIAPFSLMTYSEASPMAGAIYDAVAQDRMPPWPPDNNYQQYAHNRALNATEKSTLLSWCTNGAPEGVSANTPPPPVYNNAAVLGNGDLTVQMPSYMSKATSMTDDYACFAVPSGLLQNRTIKSIEIIPGNREIVHHALIYIDPSGIEVTDSVGGNCASPSNSNTKLIAGYTPGATPMILPSVAPLKLGIDIAAGSQVYFAMHYPAGSYGQFDSTKVIFHFYPVGTTGIRQVSADPMIQNWSFSLPANQVTNVSAQYPPGSGGIPVNVSVLSVFPHMHLLGENIKSYAIKPTGDTLKFIDIPHWDFHWQGFYFFKNIQFAPAGSKIKGEGTYNNTALNPHNPNNPPINVYAGLNTNDEMFLVYFHYMLYQSGDENYNMESLMSASLAEQLPMDNSGVIVYPNPSSEQVTIELSNAKIGDRISASVYDYSGRVVKSLCINQLISNDGWNIIWDGTNSNGENMAKGIYYVSLLVNGQVFSKQVVRF